MEESGLFGKNTQKFREILSVGMFIIGLAYVTQMYYMLKIVAHATFIAVFFISGFIASRVDYPSSKKQDILLFMVPARIALAIGMTFIVGNLLGTLD